MKHIIVDSDFILCPYCERKTKMLDSQHLKTHGKKFNDIFIDFPNTPTCCRSVVDLAKENRLKKLQEKYGENIVNISQVKEVAEKMKETQRSEEVNQKRSENIKKTWKKKIEENVNIVSEIVKKRKNTTERKHGDERYNNPEKMQQTKLERYGDKGYHNIEKMKKTMITKYGVEFPSSSKEILEKREKLRNERMSSKVNDWLERFDLKLIEVYDGAHTRANFICLKCNNIFESSWNEIQQGRICQKCRPIDLNILTMPQKDILSFVRSLGFERILVNDRTIISPWELDIVVEDVKVAIEYCGFYYHSDKMIEETRKTLKDPTEYHFMKRLMTMKKGYRLVTIFEDEWKENRDILFSRLKQILGKNSGEKIHARKCIIKPISGKIKNEFLKKYHLLGDDKSTIKLGAFYKKDLVGVMTFSYGRPSKGSKKTDGVMELNRFCTKFDCVIPGLASKLLAFYKRNYEWNEIFSYADLRWSNGDMYRKIGFKSDEKITLDYWYIDINSVKRLHRYPFRKTKDEPREIPEWILRRCQGLLRIFGCGILKFTLKKSLE